MQILYLVRETCTILLLFLTDDDYCNCRIIEFMLQTSLTDRLPPILYTFRGMFNVLTEMLKFLNGEQYFGTVSIFTMFYFPEL